MPDSRRPLANCSLSIGSSLRLQLDFILVPIEKMKLREVIISILPDLDLLAVFPSPFPLFRFEHAAFREIGVHNGMYNQAKVFMLVSNEITKVLFNFIFQQQGRRYFTGTGAAGANFLGIDIHLRLHALPGNLH